MSTHWLQFLLLAVGVLAKQESNLKFRVYESAFNFLTGATTQLVEKAVNSFVFRDVDVNVKQFKFPKMTAKLTAANGVEFSSSGGALNVYGSWKGKYFFPFKHIPLDKKDDGWLNGYAAGLNVKFTGKVNSLEGHPQLEMASCTMELASYNYSMGGTGYLPKMLNNAEYLAERAVKNAIKALGCAVFTQRVIPFYNTLLAAVPLHMPFFDNFNLDYALEQPTYKDTFYDLVGSARVVYGDKACTAATAGQFTETDLKPQMVVLWFDESIMNCILGSMHDSGVINVPINKENVPNIEPFLKTSCTGVLPCVGTFFEKLSKSNPNKYIEMSLHSHELPYVKMVNGSITFGGVYALDLHLDSMYTNPKPLAKILLEGSITVTPSVVDSKLVGKVTQSSFKFRPGPSEIGDISPTFLAMFEGAFSKISSFVIDEILQAGIPFPEFAKLTMSKSTDIKVFDKMVRANVGFELKA
ncbi:unnamed protein product [Cylicocyclus nassatus]|uniref:Lipid-binding serum glycoprotein C-terminal domain-containing protein n=1 Tax=Cylicocyclus nassatus TaxID=53992 RepID=A0AA36M4Y9_CYLNA|nr:unnamed protein product [Cylicocyclus nassatus]